MPEFRSCARPVIVKPRALVSMMLGTVSDEPSLWLCAVAEVAVRRGAKARRPKAEAEREVNSIRCASVGAD